MWIYTLFSVENLKHCYSAFYKPGQRESQGGVNDNQIVLIATLYQAVYPSFCMTIA